MVCDSNLNLSAVDIEASIKLFPNPANDFFEIVSPVIINKTLIYDSTGQLIFSNDYINKHDISGLKPGVYLVGLISDEFVIQKKLIVK